ncbi:MAG TPA: nuclear transport factor 2 family protein [Microvirga sp.]|nr:nuclear transport factor 2 family protein [Microvirga sp.]
MSEENVEIVRRLFEAVARRDTETALRLYHPEVEFDGRRHRWAELISAQHETFRGHEGLRAWAKEYYSAWENLDDSLEELVEAGEHVISIVTTRGRGKASGVEVELKRSAGVWTFRDGLISKVVWYSSPEDAFAAIGLES